MSAAGVDAGAEDWEIGVRHTYRDALLRNLVQKFACVSFFHCFDLIHFTSVFNFFVSLAVCEL